MTARYGLPEEKIRGLREAFMRGLPAYLAAGLVGCGLNTAYRHYQIFRGELVVKGRPLPKRRDPREKHG